MCDVIYVIKIKIKAFTDKWFLGEKQNYRSRNENILEYTLKLNVQGVIGEMREARAEIRGAKEGVNPHRVQRDYGFLNLFDWLKKSRGFQVTLQLSWSACLSPRPWTPYLLQVLPFLHPFFCLSTQIHQIIAYPNNISIDILLVHITQIYSMSLVLPFIKLIIGDQQDLKKSIFKLI